MLLIRKRRRRRVKKYITVVKLPFEEKKLHISLQRFMIHLEDLQFSFLIDLVDFACFIWSNVLFGIESFLGICFPDLN